MDGDWNRAGTVKFNQFEGPAGGWPLVPHMLVILQNLIQTKISLQESSTNKEELASEP